MRVLGSSIHLAIPWIGSRLPVIQLVGLYRKQPTDMPPARLNGQPLVLDVKYLFHCLFAMALKKPLPRERFIN